MSGVCSLPTPYRHTVQRQSVLLLVGYLLSCKGSFSGRPRTHCQAAHPNAPTKPYSSNQSLLLPPPRSLTRTIGELHDGQFYHSCQRVLICFVVDNTKSWKRQTLPWCPCSNRDYSFAVGIILRCGYVFLAAGVPSQAHCSQYPKVWP